MKFLRYNLWRLKHQALPESSFKKTLWLKLAERLPHEGASLAWYRLPVARFSLAAVMGLVFLGTGLTGAYAYVSPQVVEGTILYPLKKQLEQVEEKFQTTPEKRTEFHLKNIDRRAAEIQVLKRQQKGDERIEKTLQHVEQTIERADQELERQPIAPLVREKLQQKLEERKNIWLLEKKLDKNKDQERKEKGRALPQKSERPPLDYSDQQEQVEDDSKSEKRYPIDVFPVPKINDERSLPNIREVLRSKRSSE